MKNTKNTHFASLIALGLCLFNTPTHAGRPLAVDDANVNAAGAGHVEVWVVRDGAKTNTWNLAPAFAPVDGVEIGVGFAKARKLDMSNKRFRPSGGSRPAKKMAAILPVPLARCMKKMWVTVPIWWAS